MDVAFCFCFHSAEIGDVAIEVALVFAEEAVAFALLRWGQWCWGRDARTGVLTCSSGVGPITHDRRVCMVVVVRLK